MLKADIIISLLLSIFSGDALLHTTAKPGIDRHPMAIRAATMTSTFIRQPNNQFTTCGVTLTARNNMSILSDWRLNRQKQKRAELASHFYVACAPNAERLPVTTIHYAADRASSTQGEAWGSKFYMTILRRMQLSENYLLTVDSITTDTVTLRFEQTVANGSTSIRAFPPHIAILREGDTVITPSGTRIGKIHIIVMGKTFEILLMTPKSK